LRNIGFLFLRRSFNSSGRADRGATSAGWEQMAPAGPERAEGGEVAQILNLKPDAKIAVTPSRGEAPKVQAINQDPNLSPSRRADS